ncbi:hypothetical protein KCP78_15945 [Salmonella enterica subsp. enterica]|nr:hypothetical protein KCP78_15945 [Salmonella enterica subsp. enterica]
MVLTAIANDRLHDEVWQNRVGRWDVQAMFLLASTTRGNSRDIVKAVEAASRDA